VIATFSDPVRAYALISETRQWLPAYAVLVVLGLLELQLAAPAYGHLVALQSQPPVAGAQLRQALTTWFELRAVGVIVVPLIVWALVAMLLAALAIATRREQTSFSAYFALCMNCALPAEVGALLYAAATRLHPASFFHTANDLATVLPLSLAAFRPHGTLPEIAFLSYWDAFTLWSLVLLGLGYAVIAKTGLVPALLLVLGIHLSLALTQVTGS
jgi:hypothetical protein